MIYTEGWTVASPDAWCNVCPAPRLIIVDGAVCAGALKSKSSVLCTGTFPGYPFESPDPMACMTDEFMEPETGIGGTLLFS